MEKHLSWNKGIFDSNYQIFEVGEIKYSMFFNMWRSEAKAITKVQSFFFKDNGLFNPTTQIFNEKNELIGTINYDSWKTKAKINLNSGAQYTCDFVNIWHSKWIITNHSDKQINYDSSTSSGKVIANTDDELMLLLGFYIREHFTKMFLAVILIVIFIPTITRGF